MKTAIITGASGGIGKSLAHKLAEQYKVILVARSEDSLQKVRDEIAENGGTADIIAADLTKPTDRQKLYDATKDIPIDLLVNNAGVGAQATFTTQDQSKIQTMIDLNITALTELCRHYGPHMKAGSTIMNVASVVGFVPFATISVYAASKAYVLSFSEALAEEFKRRGVHVMALCPGATKTGFERAADMESTAIYSSEHLPGPDEVAEYAIQAMHQKKVVAVHGVSNRVLIFLANRLMPRGLTRAITHRMMNR